MSETFQPGPDDARALRDAFGRFATGVTVVTASGPRGPIGITANSFASVSMDPPLLLWCPAKKSHRHDSFACSSHFALHVMGIDQDEITRGFARHHADAFEKGVWHASEAGVPLLEGCPARFECTVRDRIDAGDHTVIIAHITRVTTEPGAEPRVFLGGSWGEFAPED